MRTINCLLVSFTLLTVAAIGTPRVTCTQSKAVELVAPVDLEGLLNEAGYKPVKAREGLWAVSATSNQDKYLKAFQAFVEINPNTHHLRISVRIGTNANLSENVELQEKVRDLTERLKPTEFSITKTALFAALEMAADKLDKTVIKEGIQKTAAEADRIYPEVAEFIKLDAPESTGPGVGTGFGTGGGMGRGGGAGRGDSSEWNTSRPSESNEPVKVDSRPMILNRVQPVYTPEARKNNIQGTVTLRLTVDETGAAKEIRVARGLPDGLNEQAIEAAKKTKFRPAMKDGKPVSYSILLQINFNLF